MYGVHDTMDAYRFDRAVWRFGSTVTGELESVEGKNKNEIKAKRLRVMQRFIPEATGASGGKGFKDPAKRSK